MITDEEWMQQAFQLAKKSEGQGEVPVGAIIVYQNEIIGKGWNQPILLHDPTAHAEIIALREAGRKMHNYRLLESTMYVTLEPCAGACGSVFNIVQTEELNHSVEITKSILERECQTLIKNFFKEKRLKKL